MSKDIERVLFLCEETVDKWDQSLQNSVIDALNLYNPRLNVRRIMPIPTDSSFNILKQRGQFLKRFGVIAEKRSFDSVDQGLRPDQGLSNDSDEIDVVYSTVLYVGISTNEVDSRDGYVSQILFPIFGRLIGDMEYAPGIVFSDHPVYFIDLAQKEHTPRVKSTLSLLPAIGIGYISVRANLLKSSDVPRSVEEIMNLDGKLHEYIDYDRHLRVASLRIDPFCSEVLNENRSRDKLVVKDGSHEKFYFANVFPAALAIVRMGWSLDSAEIESFLNSVSLSSPPRSKQKLITTMFQYLISLSKVSK